jgi:hypothetical protein
MPQVALVPILVWVAGVGVRWSRRMALTAGAQSLWAFVGHVPEQVANAIGWPSSVGCPNLGLGLAHLYVALQAFMRGCPWRLQRHASRGAAAISPSTAISRRATQSRS